MSENDKIEAIYQMCIEFTKKHERAEVHYDYVKEELIKLRTDTDILKEHKANFLGKVSSLSVGIGGIFTLIGYWISKHI